MTARSLLQIAGEIMGSNLAWTDPSTRAYIGRPIILATANSRVDNGFKSRMDRSFYACLYR